MFEVFVGSEQLLETLTFNKPYIHISISSRLPVSTWKREGIKLLPDKNRIEVLYMKFDDCTAQDRWVAKPILKKEAKQIWDFVGKYKEKLESGEIPLLVVNCEAGISRSPAVARSILEAFHLPLDYVYHPRFKQNFYVVKVLRVTCPFN